MDIIEFRDFCLSLPQTEETTPFAAFPGGDTILVYKIAGKMYCYTDMELFDDIALKCTPENVIELKERYEEIGKARNMSPVHWISVSTEGSLGAEFIKNLVLNSYRLVIAGLPKKKRNELIKLIENTPGYKNLFKDSLG